MIDKYVCCDYIRHIGVVRSISRLVYGILGKGLPNERPFIAVGIDVYFFPVTTFVTRLEIDEILSTRRINSNTHQYAVTFKIASCFMLVFTLLYVQPIVSDLIRSRY